MSEPVIYPAFMIPAGDTVIYVYRHKMTAQRTFTLNGREIGMREVIEKEFSHTEDLYALPLRGLLSLVREFYDELKQTN